MQCCREGNCLVFERPKISNTQISESRPINHPSNLSSLPLKLVPKQLPEQVINDDAGLTMKVETEKA